MRRDDFINKVGTVFKVFIFVGIVAGFSIPAMAIESIYIPESQSNIDIDGHIDDAEWAGASSENIVLSDEGLSIDAVLYVMNDDDNLYIGITIPVTNPNIAEIYFTTWETATDFGGDLLILDTNEFKDMHFYYNRRVYRLEAVAMANEPVSQVRLVLGNHEGMGRIT
ncbi:MAG: hypothetical protein R6U27_14550, partial [Desulfobacterales bacterium]